MGQVITHASGADTMKTSTRTDTTDINEIKTKMKKKIEINSFKAWLWGIRPTSLGGALMTVLVGAGLAHGVSPDTFSWPVAILCALFACFMQVSANLINDMVDFKRGLDKSKLYYFTK